MKKILIIGAIGQIGSELTMELRKIYGGENVIASDKIPPLKSFLIQALLKQLISLTGTLLLF
jgi:nucleoside-diphosphate-sugar epimerase